jgi:hypothetical protein
MNAEVAALEAAAIRQQSEASRMPTIAAQYAQLAEQAVRDAAPISAIWKRCCRPNSKSAASG